MNLVALSLALVAGYLHYSYVSRLFENDRFFSHLSDLEREMTFRTEAGFYYMYYKTMVRAETFTEGLQELVNDTGTEYPNHINSLKRFNVYPEVVLGGVFRVFSRLTAAFDVEHLFKACYTINRGNGLSSVTSCDGLGDEMVFYVNCIFAMAGLQVSIMFYFGSHLAGNILGGLLAVSSFFYNHSESSRVQWIPPLRESFSFPLLLLQTLLLSQTLQVITHMTPSWERRRLSRKLYTGLNRVCGYQMSHGYRECLFASGLAPTKGKLGTSSALLAN